MEVHSSPSGDLFYDPGQAPPLWYRPTAGVPAAQAVEHLFDLLSEFQERAGEDWRDEWVFPVWLSLSLFPVEEMATAQEDRLREMFKKESHTSAMRVVLIHLSILALTLSCSCAGPAAAWRRRQEAIGRRRIDPAMTRVLPNETRIQVVHEVLRVRRFEARSRRVH